MKLRCPTCGRPLRGKKLLPMTKIDRADRPTAFSAWLGHYFATGQTALARYWQHKGYLYAPSDYPPSGADEGKPAGS